MSSQGGKNLLPKRVLGIDCGRVILRAYAGSVPDSFMSIRSIAGSGMFDKIYVVSRVGTIGRILFAARLRYLNFWNYTGVSRNDLYFCKHDEDKAPVCEKLGVTDFIDDRFEVLAPMKTVERRYAFNPRPRKIALFSRANEDITIVKSWKELLPLLSENKADRRP